MSSSGAAGSSAEVLIGRCYTRARRHPVMIGRWPGGRGRIWGGPYTIPQLVVLVASLVLLLVTRAVWAHFGLLNFVIVLGVPYGLSLLVRHVQVEGRNPLSVVASSVGLLFRPSGGRLGGRPLGKARGRRPVIGVCSFSWAPEGAVRGREDAAMSVLRAARTVRSAPRSAETAGCGAVSPSSVNHGHDEVFVAPQTSAGAVGAERRPVPVAAALLAARRREIRDDVSDPRVARRGV